MRYNLREILIPPYDLPHFGVMKNVFDQEEIDRILFYEKILNFEKAQTIGEQQGEKLEERDKFRICDIASMMIDQNTQWLWDKIGHISAKANYDLFLYDINAIEDLNYLIYHGTENGKYISHRDVLMHGYRRYDRKISGIMMLSDPSEYKGGDLLIDTHATDSKEKWRKVELEKGDVVFFDSGFTHCVEPVTEGKRQVIVFWLHGKNKL